MFGFQSEYREGSKNKVFAGLGDNTVAAVGRRKFPFSFVFTAERDDIRHLSSTIESWELLEDGPFLFPTDAQAKLGLIKNITRSRIVVEKQAWFLLSNVQKCQDRTDVEKCGGFRFAERSGVDASAVAGIQTHVRPGSDNTTSD